MKTKIISLLTAWAISTISMAQIINVPGDQPSIQAGIDVAISGDIVLVAQGTYYENINFNGKAITVMSNYLNTMDSADIYNTVIDGSQPANPAKGSVVSFQTGEDTTSVICGFTIKNGTGTYPDAWGDMSGGGIYCGNSGAKIIHNRIIENELSTSIAQAFGGGISAASALSDFFIISENFIANNEVHTSTNYFGAGGGISVYGEHIIENNIIKNNDVTGKWARGAGIWSDNNLLTDNSVAIIRGNQITHNTADVTAIVGVGCGIYLSNPNQGCTISNNIISHNKYTGIEPWGGAIGILNWTNNGRYHIDGNIFEDNEAESGGAIIISSWPTGFFIRNNIFYNNEATSIGGSIYLKNSVSEDFCPGRSGKGKLAGIINTKTDAGIPYFINNTFVSNIANAWGGAIVNSFDATDIILINNILNSNSANLGTDIFTQYVNSACHLHYNFIDTSQINGNWTGNNNNSGDPLFVGTGDHPYALTAGSPCIDAGWPADWVNTPIYDILGNDRIMDGDGDGSSDIDLGAYEHSGASSSMMLSDNTNAKLTEVNLFNTPNPFTDKTTLSYSLNNPGDITIKIVDINGQEITTLVNEYQEKGEYKKVVSGLTLPPGIYFCILKTNEGIQTRKVIKVE